MNSHELIQIELNANRQKHGPSNVNRKPYRTKALKEQASKDCWKTKGGFYRSDVPVLYHTNRKISGERE